MAAADDIATIIEQERALVFPAFDEAQAFALGCRLRDMALAQALPIIIDIRLWDRPLFYAATPNSTPSNQSWARRKINAVRHFQKASYRVFLEQGGENQVAVAHHGLSADEFILAGGAFPIRVRGVAWPIGAVAISGLPSRQDHDTVVAALSAQLGIDVPALAGL